MTSGQPFDIQSEKQDVSLAQASCGSMQAAAIDIDILHDHPVCMITQPFTGAGSTCNENIKVPGPSSYITPGKQAHIRQEFPKLVYYVLLFNIILLTLTCGWRVTFVCVTTRLVFKLNY